jgi:hypothetical protein
MARHAFKKTFEIQVPAVATNVDDAIPVLIVPFDGLVDSVEFVPKTLLTGADTNTRKHEVINKGQSGAGTAVVAALQYNNGVNAAAFDAKTITRDATLANYSVIAGDVLAWVSTSPGTGIADPGGMIRIVISRDVAES